MKGEQDDPDNTRFDAAAADDDELRKSYERDIRSEWFAVLE